MVAEILASRPRFVVVADRRIHYVCEQADRWRAVDGALSAAYRRVAHAAGAADSFDVYEAVAPGLGQAPPGRIALARRRRGRPKIRANRGYSPVRF